MVSSNDYEVSQFSNFWQGFEVVAICGVFQTNKYKYKTMDKIIKFRAWHFLRKQMYDVADITFRNNFIGANALDVQKNTIDCTIGINYIDGNEKSFELMQYSGHKDKSGIEIYSGDILCYLDGFHNEIIQAVVFQNDSGAFVLEDGRPEPFNTTVNAIHDTCRVIGNIYENENLIHKKICTE